MFQNFTLRCRIPSAIVLSLLLIQILVPAQILNASPQQDLLERAQRSYVRGEFDNTLQLLRAFLQTDGITPSQKQEGLILLAKTFIARGEPQAAKEVVKKILIQDPAYHPTLEQEKPSYVQLVEAVRSENPAPKPAKPQSAFKSRWLLAGGGGLAAAIFIAVIAGSGSDSGKKTNLPLPPEFPQNGN